MESARRCWRQQTGEGPAMPVCVRVCARSVLHAYGYWDPSLSTARQSVSVCVCVCARARTRACVCVSSRTPTGVCTSPCSVSTHPSMSWWPLGWCYRPHCSDGLSSEGR